MRNARRAKTKEKKLLALLEVVTDGITFSHPVMKGPDGHTCAQTDWSEPRGFKGRKKNVANEKRENDFH